MTEKSIIHDTATSDLVKTKDQAVNKLRSNITRYNALTNCFASDDNFDVLEAEKDSRAYLEALNVKGGLQEMLAAQMLSIHQLQQISMTMANKTLHLTNKQYFSNTAIRLANVFVQQAALLAKLQGAGGQKIIVEHVEVHHGGQAVVGNINGGTPTYEEKK